VLTKSIKDNAIDQLENSKIQAYIKKKAKKEQFLKVIE
jgi:hypothetical protein